MRRWRSCDQADCEKNRDGDRHGSQVDLASPGGPISQGERLARHLGSISQGVGGVPGRHASHWIVELRDTGSCALLSLVFKL